MPSSILANESVLMTERGWINVDAAQPQYFVLGSDRHGKLSARTVAIKSTKERGQLGLVGTEATFGTFPKRVRLITQTGHPVLVASIVEDSDLEGLSFENVVQLPSTLESSAAVRCFAAAMRRSAAFAGPTKFAIRCRSRDVLDWRPAGVQDLCTFQKESQDVFCIFDETRLTRDSARDWFRTVNSLGKVVSYNSEDETTEFDLHSACAGLWYISALTRMNIRYRLSYDSLQHSLFVVVHEVQDHRTPFAQARCAYYSQLDASWILIEWQDSSWSPVVNGFLLAPS